VIRRTANDARIAAALPGLINTHTAATTLAFRTARAFTDAIGGAARITFRTDFALRATRVAALCAWWTTFAIVQALAITANARSVGAGRA
jgi:hypothetical protein